MPRCVAGFCDNTAASGHGMFTFPKDPGLNKKWRVNMKRVRSPREPHKLWENTEYSRLCGAHFEEDCFLVSHSLASSIGYMPGRLQLKPDAVPTIFKDQNQRVIQKSGSGRPAFEKRRRKEAIEQILKEAEETLELPVVPEPEDEQMPQPDIEVPVACSVDLITSTNDSEVNCLQPVTLMDNSENIPNTVTQTYHKKIQTPLRWASKLPVKRRTFSTQTKPIMVDKSTQYNPPEKDPLPPRPTYILQDDDLDTSFRSDRTMETDDHDDPDYNPEIEPDMSDNESDVDNNEIQLEHEDDVIKDQKYIVFESALVELLNTCSMCGEEAVVFKKHSRGTLVVLESVCVSNPGHKKVWQNQPNHHGLPVGNLLVAGAMLFSGSSPVKLLNVMKFLRLATFCPRTYYKIQKAYLLPAIDYVWSDEQFELLSSVTSPLKLGGDARCCSPGHTAKYGSYTLMDLERSKVIDIKLVQSNEVANSNAMELEGLKRCLQTLADEDIVVSDLTTDRHPQVKKFMRDKHPEVNHWFDVWHVSKSVKKKVESASKKKGCEILSDWSQSISNHLYFCAAVSNGDGEQLTQMWKSILNHVANIHEGHGDKFPRCLHSELDSRAWIKKESKPHKELREVIERNYLLKDIRKLSPAEQTYSLESFHSICCYFATKFVHFFYQSMEGRLKLACLHYNENSARQQHVTRAGEPRWNVYRPKFKKGDAVAKQVKIPATYNYVDTLFEEVLARREELPSYKKSMFELQPIIQSTPKPVCEKYGTVNKAEIVAAHRSRFSRRSSDKT